MRMKKIILAVVILFSLLFSINVKAVTKENPDEALNLIEGAKAGILIEQSSKEILFQKEMDRRLSPASMTKIMTLLLIYEAMENNQFNLDTMLTTSETAASMGGSQVYLKVGEKISVDEALKCVCVVSANDCAVLLAEEVSGSEEYFVRKMNEKAKSLGCNNTNFSDCTGLTSQNHYTSAYDLAIISAELLTKYPEVIKYTTIKEDYIRKDTSSPFWLVNTNKMIGRVEGLNGLKTGYTSFSGYCITLSMSKDDMNLISVVFGYDSFAKRNSESLELLKYGFSEGIKTTIQDTISVGKSAIGLITGKFDNINQMQQAIKAGGLIDGISSLLDIAISNGSKNGIFNFSTANNLIKGKDILLDSVQKNIEKTFSKQLESVENLQSHIDNWKNYFEKKDFDNMQKEFELINKDLEILVPMENTINKARVVQNLHTLIKNRDQDFNLSKEEMELCEKLV